MKRFLSLLLTVAMVFSCMSITALADDAVTFELFGSTNNAAQTFAHAGSKVLVTEISDATYKNNGTDVALGTSPVTGYVAIPVAVGPNQITAVVGDTTYGPISVYGIEVTASSVGGSFDTATGGTAVDAETAPDVIDGTAHTVAYKITAERPGDHTATNVTGAFAHRAFAYGSEGKSFITFMYGFFVGEDNTADFNVMDIRGGQKTGSGDNYQTQVNANHKNNGTLLVTVDGATNKVIITDVDGEKETTDFVVTPGQWHDIAMVSNYVNKDLAGIYIDGILVARVKFVTSVVAKKGPALMDPSVSAADGSDVYVGPARGDLVLGQFPRNTTSNGSSKSAMYADRNSTIAAAPVAPTIAPVDGEDNMVTVTASEIEGFETKVFVNGEVVETISNGDTHLIQSGDSFNNATVFAAVADAQGNVVNGFYGPLKSNEIEMRIVGDGSGEGGEEGGDDEGDYFDTFELYGSTANETSTFAHIGSKVMLTALKNATYYKNGTPVNNPVEGPVAGTRLFDITAGSNIFTAEVGGMEFGPIAIYGMDLVDASYGASLSVVGSSSISESEVEGLIDGAHSQAYTVLPERPAGGTYSTVKDGVAYTSFINSFNADVSGVTGTKRNHLSLSLGFFIDGTLDQDFNVLDVLGSYSYNTNNNTKTIGGANLKYGTVLVTVKTDNKVVITDYNGNVINTNVTVSSNEWHNLNVGVNYKENGVANIYLDGVLIAKSDFVQGYASTNPERYGPAIMKSSGGSNAYVGNATSSVVIAGTLPSATNSAGTTKSSMYADRNEYIVYPVAPAIAPVDGADNTVTVTEPTLPTELTGYETKVFVNGEVAETVPNGDNLVIKSSVADSDATVYAAIVDAQGNIVTGMYGDLLKSAEIPMNLVESDGQATISLSGNVVTIKRDALGEDSGKELAVVSVDVKGVPTIDHVTALETTGTVANNAVKVFVWVWETLKPLVAPFVLNVN